MVVGEDSPLHRRLVSAVVEVLANEGEDAGSTAYSDAGDVAILYDEEAWFTIIMVEHIRVVHLVFLYDIPKLEKPIQWILKVLGGDGAEAHHSCECADRNLRTT